MDTKLALMVGADIPVPECQLVLHQPSILELGYIGEDVLFSGLYTLNLKKTMFVEDKKGLESTTNFHIFMTVIADKEAADKKKAVLQVLQLVCPQYKISVTPRSLMFLKDDAPPVMVDDKNFEALQNALTDIFCLNSSASWQVTYNPANAKAKAIADKLMRGRQRIAAERNDKSNTSVFAQYVSILTVALNSMSLKDCLELTVYQIYDLIERYSLYMNWDIDIRSRLAGGKPDSKPDNWMKNIH